MGLEEPGVGRGPVYPSTEFGLYPAGDQDHGRGSMYILEHSPRGLWTGGYCEPGREERLQRDFGGKAVRTGAVSRMPTKDAHVLTPKRATIMLHGRRALRLQMTGC